MKSDVALLTIEQGGSPIYNPSTSAEDARLASLISLDGILKQVKVNYLPCSVLAYNLWDWETGSHGKCSLISFLGHNKTNIS